MDPITICAIAGVTLAVATTIAGFARLYCKIESKQKEIESLQQSLGIYADSYAFEDCDEQMINECRNRLNKLLAGQTFKQRLDGKNIDEQRTILKQIVNEMADSMKVRVDNLIIEPKESLILGSEQMNEKGEITLFLNEALLIVDPDKLLFTLLHELRHGVQDTSFRNNKWGFSNQRIALWMCGLRNYVQPNENSYNAYFNQVLEIDANKFADTVLKLNN